MADTFKENFVAFLDSVKNKDKDGMLSFIDEKLPMNALLPGQPPILNATDFIESQDAYFANEKASFSYQIISTEESDGLGFGACKAHVSIDANQLDLQICFLFKNVDDQWKLIFDQNTVL